MQFHWNDTRLRIGRVEMVYPMESPQSAGGKASRMPKFDHRSRPFRIELRNEVSRILDRVEGVFPQFRTLDPYASRLLQDGEEGELVLIDETTDQVVARKMVKLT